jgi:hypothetical protein
VIRVACLAGVRPYVCREGSAPAWLCGAILGAAGAAGAASNPALLRTVDGVGADAPAL